VKFSHSPPAAPDSCHQRFRESSPGCAAIALARSPLSRNVVALAILIVPVQDRYDAVDRGSASRCSAIDTVRAWGGADGAAVNVAERVGLHAVISGGAAALTRDT
jgi:hypothetical protein